MSRTHILSAALVALALGVCSQARADFKVIETPPAVTASAVTTAPALTASIDVAVPRPGYRPIDGSAPITGAAAPRPSSRGFGLVSVTYVGTAPAAIDLRQGMGRNVRLADALRQIAPAGWHGYGRADIADSFNPNQIVSWKGGRPWTDVLDILANEQDLAVEVDWERKHLYIGKRQFSVPASVAAASPVALPWLAKPGSTVRSTFEDWAKRAGWTVVWPMDDLDYRVVAPLSFDGTIVDATGKLTRLYESALRPLTVTIHPSQKLLVFSEKGSEQ